jgi:hypothetical protein
MTVKITREAWEAIFKGFADRGTIHCNYLPEHLGVEIVEDGIVVPKTAHMRMHNAAAFSRLFKPATVTLDDDGVIRLKDGNAPDWSRVYRVMVDAA